MADDEKELEKLKRDEAKQMKVKSSYFHSGHFKIFQGSKFQRSCYVVSMLKLKTIICTLDHR